MTNNKGITFVEVIVSMILVTVIAVSLIAVVSQSSVFSNRIDTVYTASYLAQRRVDLLKRFDFEQMYPAGVETNVRVDAGGNVNPNGEFLRTTEITSNYDNNPYLLKVKVSVKRIKINIDGSIKDPETGQINFLEEPVIVETLVADID